ncbi:endonuclease/exonuclease/phosphatase family protein [Pseudooceanicola sp. MF1-13]|uniref:endonuclease/exonuclease/phosphatase family protein n=1 Tax=Pseudooceanicola sp. MF1-13 TaxID=3379095 RepID=UPI00389256AB
MPTPSLTIVTYNLQKCVGMDLRRDPGRTLEVLSETGADIAVLQEVDKRLPPRPTALPRDMIRAEGWTLLPFGPSGIVGPSIGWHGNTMLIRPHLAPVRTHYIPLPGLEPRGAILAELTTPIGNLRIIGAHLGLRRRDRIAQVHAIAAYLGTQPKMPTALAGDINEWRSLAPLDHALPGLSFLDSPATFPALRPLGALDRFALSDDLMALRPPAPHLAQPARIASDHLPLTVTIARRDGS